MLKKLITSEKPIIIFEHIVDILNPNLEVILLLKEYGYTNFLAMNSFPNIQGKIRYLANPILGLIFGQHFKLIQLDEFEKHSYAFVIAVPDWLK